MILRRLSQSIKQQNWTAIWIEFVLLVAGVFLGIQVSNWNTARVDQKRADELLVRLINDMHSEKLNIEAIRDYYATTAAYAKTALREFEKPGSVNPETFVISAYQASQWQDVSSSRSTFEEIVATGAISLIHDAEARDLLIGYYEYDLTKSISITSRPRYREMIRGVMPYAIQEAIKATCGDQTKFVYRATYSSLPKQCDIDVPAQEIERAAKLLLAEPGFEQALRYQLSESDTKTDTYNATAESLVPVIAALEGGIR